MLSNEEETIKKLSLFYSGISSIGLFSLTIILLKTDLYLLFGSFNIFPIYLFLILFELFKWCIHVIIYKADDSLILENRITLNLFLKYIKWKGIVRGSSAICFCTLVYHITAVLFGAEILNKNQETLMFSILLALLTILPICIQFGNDNILNFIRSRKMPKDNFKALIYKNVLITLIGAWMGAAVIPLDWDRPWQKWPIPCSLGALMGSFISNAVYLINIIAMEIPLCQKMYSTTVNLFNKKLKV